MSARNLRRHGDEVHGLNHAQLEIASLDSVLAVLSQIQPDVIVNTAAFHHVEQCEVHPEQRHLRSMLVVRANVAKASATPERRCHSYQH